jgi:LysR family glycine cleavage system transcriptional activator
MPENIEQLANGVMLEHPQTMLHWQDFAVANGCPDLAPRHTIRFGYYTMVIRAALAGQGMALIPRALILDDLQSKRLVNPHGYAYRSDWGYWFATPQDVTASDSMKTFKSWLIEEVRALQSAGGLSAIQ